MFPIRGDRPPPQRARRDGEAGSPFVRVGGGRYGAGSQFDYREWRSFNEVIHGPQVGVSLEVLLAEHRNLEARRFRMIPSRRGQRDAAWRARWVRSFCTTPTYWKNDLSFLRHENESAYEYSIGLIVQAQFAANVTPPVGSTELLAWPRPIGAACWIADRVNFGANAALDARMRCRYGLLTFGANVELWSVPRELRGCVYPEVQHHWRMFEAPHYLGVPTPPVYAYYSYWLLQPDTEDNRHRRDVIDAIALTEFAVMVLMCWLHAAKHGIGFNARCQDPRLYVDGFANRPAGRLFQLSSALWSLVASLDIPRVLGGSEFSVREVHSCFEAMAQNRYLPHRDFCVYDWSSHTVVDLTPKEAFPSGRYPAPRWRAIGYNGAVAINPTESVLQAPETRLAVNDSVTHSSDGVPSTPLVRPSHGTSKTHSYTSASLFSDRAVVSTPVPVSTRALQSQGRILASSSLTCTPAILRFVDFLRGSSPVGWGPIVASSGCSMGVNRIRMSPGEIGKASTVRVVNNSESDLVRDLVRSPGAQGIPLGGCNVSPRRRACDGGSGSGRLVARSEAVPMRVGWRCMHYPPCRGPLQCVLQRSMGYRGSNFETTDRSVPVISSARASLMRVVATFADRARFILPDSSPFLGPMGKSRRSDRAVIPQATGQDPLILDLTHPPAPCRNSTAAGKRLDQGNASMRLENPRSPKRLRVGDAPAATECSPSLSHLKFVAAMAGMHVPENEAGVHEMATIAIMELTRIRAEKTSSMSSMAEKLYRK